MQSVIDIKTFFGEIMKSLFIKNSEGYGKLSQNMDNISDII